MILQPQQPSTWVTHFIEKIEWTEFKLQNVTPRACERACKKIILIPEYNKTLTETVMELPTTLT